MRRGSGLLGLFPRRGQDDLLHPDLVVIGALSAQLDLLFPSFHALLGLLAAASLVPLPLRDLLVEQLLGLFPFPAPLLRRLAVLLDPRRPPAARGVGFLIRRSLWPRRAFFCAGVFSPRLIVRLMSRSLGPRLPLLRLLLALGRGRDRTSRPRRGRSRRRLRLLSLLPNVFVLCRSHERRKSVVISPRIYHSLLFTSLVLLRLCGFCFLMQIIRFHWFSRHWLYCLDFSRHW